MYLDSILQPYRKCKKYDLREEVGDFLAYITDEPFYIPPSFNDVKTNIKMSTLNPKFLLFSAPGATGKSSLAKHIAYKHDAIYWNLAKIKIGTNSFPGSVLGAVGAAKYSEFIADLKSGNVMLVIDAFDEAEVVSGRKMLGCFLSEIYQDMATADVPSVILLARTETAQYIASFCAENGISILHYEIGFFDERAGKDFVTKSVVGHGETRIPDIECIDAYYDFIKNSITEAERISFLGYAPVLQAISANIRSCPNRQKLISELESKKDCVSIIMKIMDDLLDREQREKVVPAFKAKCQELHPEFSDWDRIYSPEEQLIRVIYYVLFGDTQYNNYSLEFLPSQLIDDYQTLLLSFLPQHPFVRNSIEVNNIGKQIDFTGPAFRDYSLAKIILDENQENLADLYFEESHSQSYFPSQIFFDCYMSIADMTVSSKHLSYVYDSFRAKATAYQIPYLQCSEVPLIENDGGYCVAEFGMDSDKQQNSIWENYRANVSCIDGKLYFDQLINIAIDAPNIGVVIGHSGIDTRIYNSTVVCDMIEFATQNIIIESYDPEECLLVAKKGLFGNALSIDIAHADSIRVSAPNIGNYYKLIPYSYNFEDDSTLDMVKFVYALRCILFEFRAHRKDTLAKAADRIEYVIVGNSSTKRLVLDYLIASDILYESSRLYKVNEAKMQEAKINYNALSRMDTQILKTAFESFSAWRDKMFNY